jgi:hypothetical protein
MRVPYFAPVVVLVAWSNLIASLQGAAAARCHPGGELARLSGLAEASGLALSRRAPGRLWTHNDSGEPVLFAVDATGSVQGRVRVAGAAVEDWEAIAVGPCPSGSCVYVADIGDNDASRDRVTIYRLTEPENPSGSAKVTDIFHAVYPDGAHDAETLLITGDGRLHIVTKGETGPVGIYRFPDQPESGGSVTLEKVGGPPDGGGKLITDGAVSPDGEWIALRTNSDLAFYHASELLAGRWQEVSRVDLTPLNEPQGEGLALGAGNTVFLAGEAGDKGEAGTLARFTCMPEP